MCALLLRDYDKPSCIFSCKLLIRNQMIFLVQCWIYKHLLIFSKTTNCIRPTGSCNFVSLWKNFTGAYLFQIALEIMWSSIRIAREWFFITYNIIITQKQTAYHVQNWFTHNLQMLLCFSQKSYVQSKKTIFYYASLWSLILISEAQINILLALFEVSISYSVFLFLCILLSKQKHFISQSVWGIFFLFLLRKA